MTINWINYNGQIIDQSTPIIPANNRGLKYGDGLFETIRVTGQSIPLLPFHTERMFSGLQQLQFEIPPVMTSNYLDTAISSLCDLNNLTNDVRARVTLFRGEGNLRDKQSRTQFLIEVSALPVHYTSLNPTGLHVGIFPNAKKSCDDFANIKSNNYLVYVLAGLHAKANHFDDCLVLNNHDRICDASIANVFWIKNNILYTPPLTEGCIAGVMRRYLLQKIMAAPLASICTDCLEKPLGKKELLEADELFLTNALFGLRWVGSFEDKTYSSYQSAQIYRSLF
ncbi:MAG: aminotransferase class IV [Chitinophagaceae bacterium]|nr:aminotransferase class IV [Chitinophagaceae bacterium]